MITRGRDNMKERTTRGGGVIGAKTIRGGDDMHVGQIYTERESTIWGGTRKRYNNRGNM